MGCRTNYARCSAVVLEIFCKIMQRLLASVISVDCLYRKVHERDFKHTLDRSQLTSIETLKKDFSKLDVTLSYRIIRFFKLIEQPTQTWGAKPLTNEIEIGDDVERIRIARNDFVHSVRTTFEMEDSEFQTFFTDFTELGRRVDIYLKNPSVSGFQKDIGDFKTVQFDDELERKYIAAIQEIENLKEIMKLTLNDKTTCTIFIGRSVEENIADNTGVTGSSHSRKKLIIHGLDDPNKLAAIINSLKDILSDENIIVINASEGSLILHVRIRNTVLKIQAFLAGSLTCFLKRIFSRAYVDIDVMRELDIVLAKDDKIDCNESDKKEETYFDSKGKKPLIIDVEVKDNIFKDTRFYSIGRFVEKIITKTKGTELFSEKEITAILLPRDQINYKRYGRKRALSSSTDNRVDAVATKKTKKQHLEASANISAQMIASFSPGPSRTTVTLDARISTPATGMSNFTYEENKHLSEIMNGTERSLAVARIQQQNVERLNTIIELLCGLLKRPYMAFVGSIAEGTDDGKSDKDTVWFSDYYDGFDSLTILPDERHPGYSKIQVDNLSENSELENYTVEIDGQSYLKNSVKKLIIKDRALHNFPSELSSHGAAYTAEVHYIHGESILINRDSEEVDHVLCIKRPDWPDEAAEWKTRNMHSNWPTDKLVTKITKSGYLLTAVGSKESIESEIQWRVSFNEAELLLIKSFNETQLHCIRLLKLLKKDLSKIAAKNITSYTMKNIMFWCLEKKSNDYWQPSNLMCCFCFCLSELLSCVETEFLPNYFIRKRNLFISREFTRDQRIQTSQYLKRFINDPKTSICLLLPKYRYYVTIGICHFQLNTKISVIITWLKNQVSMASLNLANVVEGLMELYDRDNIQYSLRRCNEALDKLTNVGYTQHLIKKLQNYMGVLQYTLLRKENETGEHSRSSDSRTKYSEYMSLSASGDLTHNTLRIATCYLDDGIKEKCLETIQSVTELGCQYFMLTHRQCLEDALERNIKALDKENLENVTVQEIESVLNIINNVDLIHNDPYRTTAKFEQLRASGQLLIGNDVLVLAWKRCYFDVTFMLLELPVLPKPVAVELCIDRNQTYVSFHPFLYGLLLEYLWHEKYGSGNREKESLLAKMEEFVSMDSMIPAKQKSVGLNFMAYCYSLQRDYQLAYGCLARSLRLNPIRKNVAYCYMKYKIEQRRQISSDS